MVYLPPMEKVKKQNRLVGRAQSETSRAPCQGARARFESPDASQTIGPDLVSSVRSQSLTAASEAGEEPIKQDRTL